MGFISWLTGVKPSPAPTRKYCGRCGTKLGVTWISGYGEQTGEPFVQQSPQECPFQSRHIVDDNGGWA